ncbi:MAG TPA: tetratricopeptide repeat protein [bacterium]|nr:tetratricopeptide repeat protein [bacterium]
MADGKTPFDLESFWEYSDPAASEGRFRALLPTTEGDVALELRTQIARTYSLRRRFAEAHAILNEVERELPGAGLRPRVRYLLERGRTFNSSGEKETARTLFLEAWEMSQRPPHEGLAVDAAHMIAITHAGTPQALAWNERGLALAGPSRDAKARALIPAMLNNSAWDLHEMKRFEEALAYFQRAANEWISRGKPKQIQIARWSVARCLRSLERHEEALAIQRALESEHTVAGTTDEYVDEEIAENLSALGKSAEAQPYFAKAAAARAKPSA